MSVDLHPPLLRCATPWLHRLLSGLPLCRCSLESQVQWLSESLASGVKKITHENCTHLGALALGGGGFAAAFAAQHGQRVRRPLPSVQFPAQLLRHARVHQRLALACVGQPHLFGCVRVSQTTQIMSGKVPTCRCVQMLCVDVWCGTIKAAVAYRILPLERCARFRQCHGRGATGTMCGLSADVPRNAPQLQASQSLDRRNRTSVSGEEGDGKRGVLLLHCGECLQQCLGVQTHLRKRGGMDLWGLQRSCNIMYRIDL